MIFSERVYYMSKRTAKIAATYFITIFVALLVIGGTGFFLLRPYLTDSGVKDDLSGIKPDGSQTVTTASEEYAPSYADSKTVLAIYDAEKRSSAVCFVLARFVPAENKLVIVPLQSDIRAEADGKVNTIYEFYRLGGASDAKKAITAATGIEIDRYMKFSKDSFTIFSNFMGNVDYEVPYNLVYENETTGESTIIKSGRQTLDSGTLRKVLTFPNFKGGEEYRAKVVGTITVDLINSGASGMLRDGLDSVFTSVINSDLETDITKYDYDEAKPAIEYVLDATSTPAQVVIPSGVYDDSKMYVLDDSFVQALPRWFSMDMGDDVVDTSAEE